MSMMARTPSYTRHVRTGIAFLLMLFTTQVFLIHDDSVLVSAQDVPGTRFEVVGADAQLVLEMTNTTETSSSLPGVLTISEPVIAEIYTYSDR